jgi:hypothetical protein
MKCPNCHRPEANGDWCAACLQYPINVAIKSLVEKGHVQDSGHRRDGQTCWVITDAGTARVRRENNRLN